jgi:hypothetical protein
MRFVFLFVFALALGNSALADDSGQWEEIPQEIPQDFEEYYPEQQQDQFDDGGGDVNIRIENDVTIINNYNFIDVNIYPQAPAILPMPPQPPPVRYCFGANKPWGWTIYARLYNGGIVPLANGNFPWQYHQAFNSLYWSGQCPNSF